MIVGDPIKEIEEPSGGHIKIDEISNNLDDFLLDEEEKSNDEFYTLEELEGMKNKS